MIIIRLNDLLMILCVHLTLLKRQCCKDQFKNRRYRICFGERLQLPIVLVSFNQGVSCQWRLFSRVNIKTLCNDDV